VIVSAGIAVESVIPVIVVMPGPVVPGIIVPRIVIPGMIVPGIPAPAVIAPGPVIPGIVIPRVPGPAPVIPGAAPIIIVVPQVPRPVGPGIIIGPERIGIHDGEHRRGTLRGEAYLAAGRHHQGVAFAENIGWGLFAERKEIIGLFIAHDYLCDRRRRRGVNAVVVDLCLETGHGRAGKGGKHAGRICQNVLFHCTSSFNINKNKYLCGRKGPAEKD
jgi:hypothetical protein